MGAIGIHFAHSCALLDLQRNPRKMIVQSFVLFSIKDTQTCCVLSTTRASLQCTVAFEHRGLRRVRSRLIALEHNPISIFFVAVMDQKGAGVWMQRPKRNLAGHMIDPDVFKRVFFASIIMLQENPRQSLHIARVHW